MIELPEFTKEIWVSAAYDGKTMNPPVDCGIHGCDMTFALHRNGKGITFTLFTHWMLPHVQEQLNGHLDGGYRRYNQVPSGAFVGHHSPTPTYEGQVPHTDECNITGGTCYNEGSGLLAEEYMRILIEKGSAGIWERMAEQYKDWIGE